MEKRIVYYSKNDLFYNSMRNKSIEFIESIDEYQPDSINDVLEMYSVVKYLNDILETEQIYAEDNKDITRNAISKLKNKISQFLNALNKNRLCAIFPLIDWQYSAVFWDMMNYFNLFEKFPSSVLCQLSLTTNFDVSDVMQYNKAVIHFGKELREYLLNNPDIAIELLVNYHFCQNHPKIFLPKQLSEKDKSLIVQKYICSGTPNINILKTISQLPNIKNFIISDELRLLAQEKCEQLTNELSSDVHTIHFETNIQVIVSTTLNEELGVDFKLENDNIKIVLSESWIKNHQDYPTLLNNFIYLLGLVDGEMRIANISKDSNLSVFEQIASKTLTTKQYKKGGAFDLLNAMALLSMVAYCDCLETQCNIRPESLIEWFFTNYIKTEFGIDNFFVYMPSAGCTYLEKCRLLCCEMESVIKQFNTYVSFGKINHDIIEIASAPVNYKTIQSMFKNKYMYLKKQNCNNILFFLFSDQAGYTSLLGRKGRFKCLFDILKNGPVNQEEFTDYQKRAFRTLIDENILSVSNTGDIAIKNMQEAIVLFDLYKNEFATTSFYEKKNYSRAIESLIQKDWIEFDGHLLSKQESDYFNFYLNKSQFSNGYDLRNKYIHGAQSKRGEDIHFHKENYFKLLMLFAILIIKINDELCATNDT